jgi:hypothetical protein
VHSQYGAPFILNAIYGRLNKPRNYIATGIFRLVGYTIAAVAIAKAEKYI